MHVNGTTFGHTLYVIPDLNSEIILMHSVKTVKLSYHEIFCTSLSKKKKFYAILNGFHHFTVLSTWKSIN